MGMCCVCMPATPTSQMGVCVGVGRGREAWIISCAQNYQRDEDGSALAVIIIITFYTYLCNHHHRYHYHYRAYLIWPTQFIACRYLKLII